MHKKLILILFLLVALPCVSGNIYIINDTQKDHYALEIMQLSGDLETNELKIRGSGEVISGSDVKVYLLGPGKDFLVRNVIVNGERAAVSFDDKGYYFIAQKGKFDFTGDLLIRTLGQIRLEIPGPLNEIQFDIKNGYTVEHDKYGLFEDSVIIQRREEVSKRADGEFHYMFDPYRNNFEYKINIEAFGSDIGRYELPLRNSEQIENVDGALRHHITGNNLVLELEGSSASVVVSGTFGNTNLRVPVDEGKHHVLVESDPEKKISVSTNAREIDLSESPIHRKYSNARAFIASSNERININVQDLDLLPSLSASIRSSKQSMAITRDGGVVGHTEYRYDNTGVDYIPIELPGTPLFASTSRGPVKLTKDSSEDQFLLALPKQNNGRLELIYYETIQSLGVFSYFELPLTDVDLPITTQDISIIIPDDYYVLNMFGAKGGSELPTLNSLIVFVVVLGILSYLLFRNYTYTLLSLAFFGFLMLFEMNLFLVAVGLALVIVIRRYTKKSKINWKKPLVITGIVFGALIIIAGVFFLLAGLISNTFLSSMEDAKSVRSSVEYDVAYEEAMSMEKIGEDCAQMSAPMREGVLPVKLELPQLGKRITVTDHLVTKEKPSKVHVLMVAEWLKYLLYLIGLICGFFCIRKIKAEWKNIWYN